VRGSGGGGSGLTIIGPPPKFNGTRDILLLPLPTLLLALYPNGRLPSRWWRWPVAAAALGIGLVTLASMLHPHPYGEIAPGPPPVTATTLAIVFGVTGGALLAAGAVVIWIGSIGRLLRARPPERQQLAWLLFVVVPLIVVAFGTAPMPVFLALGFGIPVAVAVGVLRYHLLGIEVVLRRGLVYGGLTAMVVGVYLLVTTAAGARLDRGPLPGVVAAALVAVGLTPLRDRLQTAVDRLVYGDRRDPMRAVTRLGDRVAAAGETDLLPAVLATVTDAVRAPGRGWWPLTERCWPRTAPPPQAATPNCSPCASEAESWACCRSRLAPRASPTPTATGACSPP
jgi:hypothetical protein